MAKQQQQATRSSTNDLRFVYVTDAGEQRIVTGADLAHLDPKTQTFGDVTTPVPIVRSDAEEAAYRDAMLATNSDYIKAHGPAEPTRGHYRAPRPLTK